MGIKLLVLILTFSICLFSCQQDRHENSPKKDLSGVFGGVYNIDEHYLDLREDLAPGAADMRIDLSKTGFIPLIGNWGEGVALAIFEEASCKFIFYNNLRMSQVDHILELNCDGKMRQPISGDWTGDGKTKVGIYFSDTGKVLLSLDNKNSDNVSKFDYGAPNDGLIAITGDWDNDQVITIGVWSSRENRFDLINQNASGVADISFKVKNASNAYPFAILNKTEKSYVGWYSSETGLFHVISLDSFEELETIEFGAKNSKSLPIFRR